MWDDQFFNCVWTRKRRGSPFKQHQSISVHSAVSTYTSPKHNTARLVCITSLSDTCVNIGLGWYLPHVCRQDFDASRSCAPRRRPSTAHTSSLPGCLRFMFKSPRQPWLSLHARRSTSEQPWKDCALSHTLQSWRSMSFPPLPRRPPS